MRGERRADGHAREKALAFVQGEDAAEEKKAVQL